MPHSTPNPVLCQEFLRITFIQGCALLLCFEKKTCFYPEQGDLKPLELHPKTHYTLKCRGVKKLFVFVSEVPILLK